MGTAQKEIEGHLATGSVSEAGWIFGWTVSQAICRLPLRANAVNLRMYLTMYLFRGQIL